MSMALRGADQRWDGGQSVTEARLAQIIAESGTRIRGRNQSAAYLAELAEATNFLADVLEGRRSVFWLQEAMSTSDFPLLMGDILDRQLLGKYAEIPATWPAYAKRGTVADFRQARRLAVDGLEGRYYPDGLKPELTSVLEGALSETGYTTQVNVYEKGASINWRMLVNDDLDAFRDIPERLARGARRTEEYFATTLFVDSNGPHASLYSSGNSNIINTTNGASDDNPPLSISGLQDAMTVLSKQRDADGEPIALEMVTLVVPPALEVVANNLINATQLWIGGSGQAGQGGTANQMLQVANWMQRRVQVVVNPYIPVIATTNGNTSWFMFASPNVGRPALEMTFLRGYEGPLLFEKAPNTMRVGGGVERMMGDFDTMSITYKGMVILGGTRLDPKMTVGSNGTSA